MPSADAVTHNPEVDLPGLPLPLTGRTSIFAILGDPIAQAGSPALFNTAFRRRGWPAVLVPMQVKATDLATTLQGLRGIGNLRGLVLTTPHKVAAVRPCRQYWRRGAARGINQCHPLRARRTLAWREF